jgi:hypothetical protein
MRGSRLARNSPKPRSASRTVSNDRARSSQELLEDFAVADPILDRRALRRVLEPARRQGVNSRVPLTLSPCGGFFRSK